MSLSSIVLGSLLGLLPLQGSGEIETKLALGEPRTGRVPDVDAGKRARSFTLTTTGDELLTISAESVDFDADVTVSDDGGASVAQAAGGGVGTNARVTFRARAGVHYTVEVRVAGGGGSEFVVRADRGSPPLPQGVERTRAELSFWTEAADRAEARKETKRAIAGRQAAGQYALRLGRTEEALRSFRSALALSEESSNGTAATEARAFAGIAAGLLRKYDEALELMERARFEIEDSELRETMAPLHARLLIALGDAHLERGETDRAEDEFEQLLALARARSLTAFESDALGRLAQVALHRDRLDEATALCDERVELAASLGDSVLADALYRYGLILREAGDLPGAREKLARALERPLDPIRRGRILVVLGEAEERAGHLALARTHHEEALALFDDVGHERGAALALRRLAHVARNLADLRTADELLEQALERTTSVDLRIGVLHQLGAVRGARGDAAGRIEAHREAVDLARDAGLRALEINARINLGQALREAGNHEGARSEAEDALGAARANHERELEAHAQTNLGYLDYLDGRPGSAIERSEAAIGLSSRTEIHIHALETVGRSAIALEDLERAGAAVEQAWDAIDAYTGGLTIDEASRWRSLRSWWAETLEADLVHLEVGRHPPSSPEHDAVVARGLRGAGRWKHRALLETLATQESVVVESPWNELVDSTTALIEYSPGSDALFGYVVTSTDLHLLELGPRAELEDLAGEFVRSVMEVDPLDDVVELGERLGSRLLAPLVAELPHEVRQIVIIPTAELTGVPFEALVLPSDEAGSPHRYLIDDYSVTYAPSSQVAATLTSRPPRSAPHRAALIADPVYALEHTGTPSAPRGTPDPLGFPRLEATRDEVFEIARLLTLEDYADERAMALLELQGARSGRLEAPGFTLSLGSQASTRNLIGDLATCSVLHVGAHGYVDYAEPGLSGLALTFADEDPGFLSVSDVLELDLELELAVLSACDTARGKIRGGEGTQSLAHAFLQAGARSVIASLWQVRDVETSLLMRSFYRHYLRDGKGVPHALRAAKLERRRAQGTRGEAVNGRDAPPLSHPYFWAACIYIGPPTD